MEPVIHGVLVLMVVECMHCSESSYHIIMFMVQKSLIAIKIVCPSLNFLVIMVPSIILLCVSLLSWNMRTKEDREQHQ
jgi:formate hydrogenlyase subunit 3/multisubunit Na+/H+ antiporter MnhD subunit